jgi:hypothetical protein
MALALENVVFFIEGDPSQDLDGSGNALCNVSYDLVDGAARHDGKNHQVASPDWTKIFHNTGAVGEFVRDEIDTIKAAEGIV